MFIHPVPFIKFIMKMFFAVVILFASVGLFVFAGQRGDSAVDGFAGHYQGNSGKLHEQGVNFERICPDSAPQDHVRRYLGESLLVAKKKHLFLLYIFKD